MKFTAPARDLADALSLASTAVRANKKPAPPALCAVRVEATTCGRVYFTCFDRCIVIRSAATATVSAPGVVVVSASRLFAMVSAFADGAMITVAEDGIVSCGDNARYKLPTIRPEDLPAPPALIGEITKIVVTGDDCLRLLEPLPASDGEISRFYLASVFWHSVDTDLIAVSTNGKVLIKVAIAADKFSTDRQCIRAGVGGVGVTQVDQADHAGRGDVAAIKNTAFRQLSGIRADCVADRQRLPSL